MLYSFPAVPAQFGGEAAHQDGVLERGYGTWVRNFRAILKHHRIDEAETVEALREKLLNEPYEKIGEYAAEYLKGKGVENAKKLMEALNLRADDFNPLL